MTTAEEEESGHCADCGEKLEECRCVDYPDDSGESDNDKY